MTVIAAIATIDDSNLDVPSGPLVALAATPLFVGTGEELVFGGIIMHAPSGHFVDTHRVSGR